MSDFTIEQLEALKEGITPGPWEVNRSEIGVREIVDGEVDLRYLTTWEGEFDNDNDAELAAAAPALVDALIAEKRAHQKLRAEVEGMKAVFESRPSPHGDYMYAQGWDYAMELTEMELARILEADNE